MDAALQQYLVPLVKWLAALLTPAEWSGLVWIVVGVFVFTHFIKIAWRLSPLPGGGKPGAIHLVACLVGLVLAYSIWPVGGHAPFWIAGPVGAGGAIGIFKGAFPLLQFVSPALAAKFNADRRKDPNPIPPAGITERRKNP